MSFGYCRGSQDCKDNDVPIDYPSLKEKLMGYVVCSSCDSRYILDDHYKEEAIEELYTEHLENRKVIKTLCKRLETLESKIK